MLVATAVLSLYRFEEMIQGGPSESERNVLECSFNPNLGNETSVVVPVAETRQMKESQMAHLSRILSYRFFFLFFFFSDLFRFDMRNPSHPLFTVVIELDRKCYVA